MSNNWDKAITEVWQETEKKLRKDEVGREVFRILLKRVYERTKNDTV